MKIELEIPDVFINEGNMLHIITGKKRLAFKPWDKKWRVKASGCSECGKCCENIECDKQIDGKCIMPIEWIPFRCITTEPSRITECTSIYKEV